MRLSRPCYDKPHRCPGQAGGGAKSARKERCEGGYITTLTLDLLDPQEWPERTCTCGTAIVATNPERGHNTSWTGVDGTSFCPQTSPGWSIGHRPPLEYMHPGSDKWRFGHCGGHREENQDRVPGSGCDVLTIPWALRYLDPTWWISHYSWRIRFWFRGVLNR